MMPLCKNKKFTRILHVRKKCEFQKLSKTRINCRYALAYVAWEEKFLQTRQERTIIITLNCYELSPNERVVIWTSAKRNSSSPSTYKQKNVKTIIKVQTNKAKNGIRY